MNITRRGFIKGMGVAAGATGLSFSLPTIARAADRAEASAAATAAVGSARIKSTCVQCVNFCGIEAQMEGGVIRAIYPDQARAAYYNWGICPKGASGGFNTYNPYRLKKPMKRTNPEEGHARRPEVDGNLLGRGVPDSYRQARQDKGRQPAASWSGTMATASTPLAMSSPRPSRRFRHTQPGPPHHHLRSRPPRRG